MSIQPTGGENAIDGNICFKNSQGVELLARLLKLNRFQVVCEVYSPEAVVRVSEVSAIFEFRRRGGRFTRVALSLAA